MFKISDKTGKFLLNYIKLFWGSLFIRTQFRPILTKTVDWHEKSEKKKGV